MATQKYLVIYCRFSSDLQSTKSCQDQEREVREVLTRMDIDHSSAIVIYDKAESGTKDDRDGFMRVSTMMLAGTIAILTVDDQSRLSRSDNTFAFITDLVYSGSRFLSTGEGIDTEQIGWELRVKVMELHNSTTIRELGRRVHRGQLGRVIDLLSAGDFGDGYESYLINPEQAAENRGPKPERGLRIREDQAKWIRQVFEWFNAGRSIAWIANELTQENAPKGHRHRSKRWRARHVRKILGNKKYIGHWGWGATRTIRNSKGKKKQIPVSKAQQVAVNRPELRIIDDATWKKAQAGLQRLKDMYGKKPGQKHRGPKVHHTELYPEGLLAGLIFCSKCGARMWQQKSGPRCYLGCPNRGTDEGSCELTTSVPVNKAEAAILEFLAKLLTSWPEWLEKALAAMRQRIEEVAQRVPNQVANDERRLKELESQIANLVDALANGRVQSQAVSHRLDEAEHEAGGLRRKIDEAHKLLSAPIKIPDDKWISQQLDDLASVIRDGDYETSLLLRKIFGRVEADQVIPPGKARGFARLRIRINGCEMLKTILKTTMSHDALDTLLPSSDDDTASEKFIIDLGGPTLMDEWAPKIAEMRANGTKWTKIVEITGLDLNRAYRTWKRFVDAQKTTDDGDDEATPESLEPEGDVSDDSDDADAAA